MKFDNPGITLLILIVIMIFGPIAWFYVSPLFTIVFFGLWFIAMHLDFSKMDGP